MSLLQPIPDNLSGLQQQCTAEEYWKHFLEFTICGTPLTWQALRLWKFEILEFETKDYQQYHNNVYYFCVVMLVVMLKECIHSDEDWDNYSLAISYFFFLAWNLMLVPNGIFLIKWQSHPTRQALVPQSRSVFHAMQANCLISVAVFRAGGYASTLIIFRGFNMGISGITGNAHNFRIVQIKGILRKYYKNLALMRSTIFSTESCKQCNKYDIQLYFI